MNNKLESEIHSMQRASGLTEYQAKTSVYYAIVTWLDDVLDFIPILNFIGNSGTGKSKAIDQLEKLVASPHRVVGKTYSEIGRNLDKLHTAIIEEGDFRQARTEELMRDRCSRQLANLTIHLPPDQRPLSIYNFGATLVHKRIPFADTATRNRTINIKTIRRPGEYTQTAITSNLAKSVAAEIRKQMPAVETSDRVSDAWKPLTMVAIYLDDREWQEYELEEMKKAERTLAMGDEYEPEDVLIKAIRASSLKGFTNNMKLVDIKRTLLNNFDLKWTSQRIHSMLLELGFQFRFYAGYDWLVADESLLRQLAKERGLDISQTEPELSSVR